MAGIFSDVRKTAAGAFGLLVLAVLFADPSGMGGGAVADAEAGRQNGPGNAAAQVPAMAAPPRPVNAGNPDWFAGEGEAQPVSGAISVAPPPPQAAASAEEIPPPLPMGVDFPQHRRRN